MSITRFDKFTPRDYGMDWYVPKEFMPNFEAWDDALGNLEKRYDAAQAFTNQNPKYLQTEQDRQLFAQYKDYANQASRDITNAYKEQGVLAGNRMLKQKAAELAKQWQPGGQAYALEDRYSAYAKGLEDINKAYEKDARGINKQFASEQLRKQLDNPLNYDQATGNYTRIATPELYQDPNIQNLILQAAKEIDESGNTEIVRKNADWFEKIKTTGKPEEKLKMIADAIYEQYPQQSAIEVWNRKRQLDPSKVQEAYNTQLDKQLEKTQSTINNLNNLGSRDIKQLQSELSQSGIDVKLTGKADQQTKDALNTYYNKQKTDIDKQKQNFDFDAYIEQDVKQGYQDYAKAFSTKKVDRDLIHDPTRLAEARLAQARAQTQALLGLTESLAPKPATDSVVLPDKAIDLKVYNDVHKQNKELKTQLEQDFGKSLEGTIFNGWTRSNVAEAYNVWEMTRKQNPKATEEELRKIYKTNLNANSPNYKFDENQSNQLFNEIAGRGNQSIVKQNMDHLASVDESIKMIEDNQANLSAIYTTTPEGKEAVSALRKTYNGNDSKLSDQQIANLAFTNPEMFELRNTTGAGTLGFIGRTNSGADRFKSKMESDIKKQQKTNNNLYSGALNTYAVHVGKNDDYLTPSINIVNDAINEGNVHSFASEGKQGLIFRNSSGNEVDWENVNVTDAKITPGPDGTTKYVATGVIKTGEGKGKTVSSVIDLVPGNPMTTTIRQGLIGGMGNNKQAGNEQQVNGYVRNIMGIDGYNFAKPASIRQIRLNQSNTEDGNNILVKGTDGQLRPIGSYGNRVKRVDNNQIVDNYGNFREYETYKVLGTNGEESYINVGINNGQRVVIPSSQGQNYYKDPLDIDVENYTKRYMLEVPSVQKTTKIQNAPVLNEAQQAILIQQNMQE